MHDEFAEILENVPIPTFVIDKNHIVKYWNRACEEFTGMKKEEIIGTSDHWRVFFSKPMPLLADVVLDGVEEFYRRRKVKKRRIRKVDENTYELELYLPHVKKWVYFRAALLRGAGGITGAIETMEDITERKRMEDEIKRLSELYRLVGEAVSKSESIEELATNLIQNLMKALNFDMGEILIYHDGMLKAITQVGFNEEFGERSAKIQKVSQNSKSTAVVTALKMEPLYIPDMKVSRYTEHFHDLCIKCDLNEMYSVPLISGGELQGVMQLIVKSGKSFTEMDRRLIDTISEHMAAGIAKIRACEERLEERKKYRGLFESSMDAVVLTDVSGKIVEVNRAAEELFGYTKEELTGKDMSELYADPSDEEALMECLSTHGFTKNFEVRYLTRNKDVISCLESSTILRDENGEPAGCYKVIKDITERKMMEDNLRKLNKLLQISSDINQLIVHEKNEKALLRKACKSFEEFEDYLSVWAGIVKNNKVQLAGVTGKLNRGLLKNYLEMCLPCVEEVLKTGKARVVKWGDKICINCPMKEKHRFMQTLVMPILYEGKIRGILSFNSPIPKIFGAEEMSILLDLMEDLGFALKAIEVEKERKAALKQLRENIKQFEYLADRLRNPLAIVRGYLDLRNEVSSEVILEEVETQITRIHKLLDELRKMERRTFRLKELLNGK